MDDLTKEKMDEPRPEDAESAYLEAVEPDENGKDQEANGPRITDALQNLPMFEDLFLGMQAMNLEIVDSYIEDQVNNQL